MRRIKLLIFAIFATINFSSCGALLPATISRNGNVNAYRYFFVEDTKELTSSAGSVYNNGTPYGTYGSTVSKSVNPSDVISGYLIKKGFIKLPSLNDDLLDKTMIVNYGESGRRMVAMGLGGYTMEVTLQFISAENHSIICTCSGEGQGSTEADDIRVAITRCLDIVFSSDN